MFLSYEPKTWWNVDFLTMFPTFSIFHCKSSILRSAMIMALMNLHRYVSIKHTYFAGWVEFSIITKWLFLLGKLCYKDGLSKRRDKTPVLLSKFLWSIRNIIYNQFHNVACKRVLTKEKFQLFHLYGEMSSLRCQCLLSRVCAVMSRMYVVKNVNWHAQNKEVFFFSFFSFLFFFFFFFLSFFF